MSLRPAAYRWELLVAWQQGRPPQLGGRAAAFSFLAGLTCLCRLLPSWPTPHRTLKRKSSNTKRLSPVPQLGPSADTHTSYYSESVVRESYFGSPRAASLARSAILDDQLQSDPYWSECPKPFSWGFASLRNLRLKICPAPSVQAPGVLTTAGPEEGL